MRGGGDRSRRRGVTALLLVVGLLVQPTLLTVGAAAAPVTPESTDRLGSATQEQPNRVEITVRPTDRDGVAEVVVTVRSPSADRYGLRLGSRVEEVVRTRNAEPGDEGPNDYLVSDRSEPMTVRFRAAVTFEETDGYRWAFVDTERLVRTIYYPDTGRFVFGGDGNRTVATRLYTYYGDPAVSSRTVDGVEVQVVTRAGSRYDRNPGPLLETVGTARDRLAIGNENRRVTVFVRPEPEGSTSGQGGADSLWIAGTAENPVPIVAHEYVHTRQTFQDPANHIERTRWLIEATADYYGDRVAQHRCAYEAGYAEFVRQNTVDRGAEATLSDPSTWGDGQVPYAKGGRVLAALDARIRNATDGDATLLDAFERLNSQERLTASSFERAVEETAGREFDAFLDSYVRGDAVPGESALPADPTAFGFERCPSDIEDTPATEPGGDDPADSSANPAERVREAGDGTVVEPVTDRFAGLMATNAGAVLGVAVLMLLPFVGLVVLVKLLRGVRRAVGLVASRIGDRFR